MYTNLILVFQKSVGQNFSLMTCQSEPGFITIEDLRGIKFSEYDALVFQVLLHNQFSIFSLVTCNIRKNIDVINLFISYIYYMHIVLM